MKCSIKDLLDFVNESGININKFSVNGRYGFKTIEAIGITAHNSLYHTISTQTKSIKVSPYHLLSVNNNWIKAEDISEGDMIDTYDLPEQVISNVISNDKIDLYDIQVSDIKEYYANDIVSHNSTMAEVLSFNLYGRVPLKKPKELINRFNNHLETEMIVESQGHIIKIERYLKPDKFDIYVDGELFDQAGKRNIQEYLTEELLGIPYGIFNNIISLSINDFKSFVHKMSKNDKRAIIDRIFGLTIFNKMLYLVRNENKKVRDDIIKNQSALTEINQSIDNSVIHLEKLGEKIKNTSEDRIGEIRILIDEYTIEREKFGLGILKLRENEQKVRETLHKLNDIKSKNEQMVTHANEKIELYNEQKCPTCETELDTEYHHNLADDYRERKATAEINIEKAKLNIIKVRDTQSKINSSKEVAQSKIHNIDANINNMSIELAELSSTDNINEQTNTLNRIIDESKERLLDVNKELNRALKRKQYFSTIEEIVGDKGIKQLAISNILPTLNNEIRNSLNELGMHFDVDFDDQFNATIKHMGYEVPSSTLSTGQKKKIDFAVLVSIIKLLKYKFPGLNLMFLDEIFSSIDENGRHHILKLLERISKELGLNIFVINHSQLPLELFDYSIHVDQTDGFSSILTEKIG